jgi:hypothetical protein
MLLTGLVSVFSMTLITLEATDLPYFDPPESERSSLTYLYHGSGSIPLLLGEKLVTEDTRALSAKSLVAVVNAEYASVKDWIRAIVAERYGIAKEHDGEAGPIPRPDEDRPPYRGIEYPPWPPLGERLAIFGELGETVQQPREYELISLPYNRLESLDGYSELRIRVSDGQDLLGKKATILQIRRRDYSKEWARLHHALPLPLPYKNYRAFTVITDTEVKTIEQLKEKTSRLRIRYLAPNNRISDRSYLQDVLAAMKKSSEEGEDRKKGDLNF